MFDRDEEAARRCPIVLDRPTATLLNALDMGKPAADEVREQIMGAADCHALTRSYLGYRPGSLDHAEEQSSLRRIAHDQARCRRVDDRMLATLPAAFLLE